MFIPSIPQSNSDFSSGALAVYLRRLSLSSLVCGTDLCVHSDQKNAKSGSATIVNDHEKAIYKLGIIGF
jgi:hypothetical protein